MSDHIIHLLEKGPVSRLSPDERAAIAAHNSTCSDCRRAFAAAEISSELLRARAGEAVEPSPFFQTRALAAVRAQSRAAGLPPLRRLWQSAAVLVSSMVAVTLVLLALTWWPGRGYDSTLMRRDSVTRVLLDDRDWAAETPMTDAQVLATVYDSEDVYGYFE